MTSTLSSRPFLTVLAITAIGGHSHAAGGATDAPRQSPAIALFATDTNAASTSEKPIPGVAAVVDGHVIPMEDVILACLRNERSFILDQMLQGYVVDRECQRRGLAVSEAGIDARVARLRADLAPATLEDTIKSHHSSMAEVRDAFRWNIEKTLLVTNGLTHHKMIHCRGILVKYGAGGGSSTNRTEAQALELMKEIQTQLRKGTTFSVLVDRYSDDKTTNGDMGVFYDNMMNQDPVVLDAVMALHKGEVSPPILSEEGYRLIRAISTDTDHPVSEDPVYRDADRACCDLQMRFLSPKMVVDLLQRSRVVLVEDAELAPRKPLPENAAVIDGHPIPMQVVLEKCLAASGPKWVDVLVQNYIVNRECERRGITVADAEIERRVEQLRKQIAPTTLEEGLKNHHTTLEGLRNTFKQEIQRTRLVIDQVPPTKMTHARVIWIGFGPSESPSRPTRTDAQARALILDIRKQLKEGKGFEELARQYSDIGNRSKEGDIGILYESIHEVDTAVLNTALGMKKGDVTPRPVYTGDGYFLLQVVSTSDDHSVDENAAYADALNAYHELKAPMLVPQAIVDLLKKSKVIYYVHS